MLRSISWGQFGCFLLVASGGYYLFVGMKFYGKEVRNILSGQGRKRTKERIKVDETRKPVVEAQVPDFAEGGQPVLFGSEDEMGKGSPEMFKVVERVIALLKEVVNEGVARKINREELIDHLTEVLGKYGQLKGTQYQEAVNNFLVRTCSSNFSLALGEKELEVLWN